MSQISVLIVDDEDDMRNLIEMYLQNSKFHTIQAKNGEEALEIIKEKMPDIVLLDVMMPRMNGFEVCKEIRKISNVPVIFLSARGEEWDKVEGLKIGGDDYVVKPFNPGELVARIQSLLRRSKSVQIEEATQKFQVGKISINFLSHKVSVDNEIIPLTLKEYDLLAYLIQNANTVLSREQLLENVWGANYKGSLRTVDTHIKTMRMKLQKADYIQTVWGIGYKFESQDE